ncbi:MDR family MFS transporter [Streptacidiphilus melanogenes]|uniref:MDR family MFS transporter n=1 Tax=Streptacidiphilus melanogenes TaxID=411235 RepID=UPI0006948181|nr:MDR family MFS transporter [Streptacidiphilus melanogenes]
MDELIAGDPPFIGPYRLIARLGAGGMGLVYLGRSEHGRTVAVKVVQAEYAGHPEFRRRFAREVSAARQVGGSWTATVLDGDPEAPVPWVATQYIPGPDLHTVVSKDFGPLPETSVRTLANRLALALQAVHRAGLIHRDLKPSNVLVTVDGPRVIDFGIARAMDSLAGDSLLTRTGMLIGSPGFMSPEQVRGLELTPASDVFCLGAVLVYAATGRLLFGAGDSGLNAHLFRIAEEEPDLTGVPDGLVDLVRACLHKNPAERPTLEQLVERTAAADESAEWLPSPVLAQLGRHAAELLDYAPVTPSAPPVTPPQYPGYTPTAAANAAPRGFGPPPGPGPWLPPPAPVPVRDAGPVHSRRWLGLAVVVLAQLMVGLQVGTFNVSVPEIQRDLHISHQSLTLLVNTYTVAFAALVVLGGHVSDVVGRKPALAVGLAGFGAASLLGGAAPNSGILLAARALQGLSAALVTAAALALVVASFTDPRERRTALGIYAAAAGGGTALGMFAGGSLDYLLSWRVTQFAGVPVAVVLLVGVLAVLHDDESRVGARVDPAAVALGTGGLLALTLGLTRAGSNGWTNGLTLVLLFLGVPLFLAFLWQQARSDSAASPRAGAESDRFGGGFALLLTGAGLFALLTSVTFFLEEFEDLSPLRAGLGLVPLAVAVLVAALVSARLLDRAAPRVPAVTGSAVAALGLVLLAFATPHGSYTVQLLPGLVLVGLGVGLALVPLLATVTSGVPTSRAGAVSSTVGAALQAGAGIGAALFAVPLHGSIHDRYVSTLWWAVGGVLLAALVAGLMITARPEEARSVPTELPLSDRGPAGT